MTFLDTLGRVDKDSGLGRTDESIQIRDSSTERVMDSCSAKLRLQFCCLVQFLSLHFRTCTFLFSFVFNVRTGFDLVQCTKLVLHVVTTYIHF